MDREFHAKIAEQVMGWRWFRVVNIAVLVPPWVAEDWDHHPALYEPIDGPGKLKREHIDGQWFQDLNCKPEIPYFTTDITAAVSAVRHAMKGHTHWTMRFLYSGHGVSCALTIPSYEYSAFADTEAEAMCKAILKFVEDKR